MINSSIHAMSRLEAPRALRAGWVLLALQRVQRALKALSRHLRSHAALVTHGAGGRIKCQAMRVLPTLQFVQRALSQKPCSADSGTLF